MQTEVNEENREGLHLQVQQRDQDQILLLPLQEPSPKVTS